MNAFGWLLEQMPGLALTVRSLPRLFKDEGPDALPHIHPAGPDRHGPGANSKGPS